MIPIRWTEAEYNVSLRVLEDQIHIPIRWTETAFDLPRSNAAKALRLEGYGIEPGNPADFVLLATVTAREALRLQPPRRYVVRNGRVVATTSVQRNTRA